MLYLELTPNLFGVNSQSLKLICWQSCPFADMIPKSPVCQVVIPQTDCVKMMRLNDDFAGHKLPG